ncbi:MAG: hypothetical protein KGI90_10395 [Burkholderiales bacterium]|nr:hypothetical protein [Burkholderiales bacterium]MDE2276937.1 hypothetical protein [Burkholderiales bacterium]
MDPLLRFPLLNPPASAGPLAPVRQALARLGRRLDAGLRRAHPHGPGA